MMVGLHHYIALSAVLFVLGAAGVLLRRNALIMLMSIELMLNASNLALLGFARFQGDNSTHVLVILIMTVAAAEAAVGLALILALFRHHRTVNADEMRSLRG